jgi:nucleoside-diphosphate-sugar epimerase
LSRSTPDPTRATLPCAPGEVDWFLGEPTAGVAETLAGLPGPFLVLGAGGKMGLHLCLMLRRALDALKRPDVVTAVSRFTTLRDRDEFQRHGIVVHACDLSDPAALAALPEAPTVFFLAGAKFGTAANTGLLQTANVEIPRKVAQRFRESRIAAFSTGCVYPFVDYRTGGATEETPVAPVGDYAISCLGRETEFSAGSRQHGTPVVLIRLNYSVEFRYGVLVDIAQKVLAGLPVDVTTGYFNVIWQRDAIAHVIQAAPLAGSPAVPLNLTGPETLSVRQIALRFGEIFGREANLTGKEVPTAWLNNASKSHRLFGPPPTSVEQMMSWIAAWLLQRGETWGKPTAFERRDGKF